MKKSILVIIDTTAYHREENEISRLGVEQIILKNREKCSKVMSKRQEIILGISLKLLEIKNAKMNLVLYSQVEGLYSKEIEEIEEYIIKLNETDDNPNLDKNNRRVKALVSLQSLFFYFGWRSAQISKVFCLTKERWMFSRNFYKTINNTSKDIKIQIFNPLDLEIISQIKIIPLFVF